MQCNGHTHYIVKKTACAFTRGFAGLKNAAQRAVAAQGGTNRRGFEGESGQGGKGGGGDVAGKDNGVLRKEGGKVK